MTAGDGTHYEAWEWDFTNYVADDVATSFSHNYHSPNDIEPFFDAFWANPNEYTNTDILSTLVPQHPLGRWGVVQLQNFRDTCLENAEEATDVLSTLFSEDRHLVDRLVRFSEFASCDGISNGNLRRESPPNCDDLPDGYLSREVRELSVRTVRHLFQSM